ncbi:MAG: VOC family protein [Gammaproteobacteria bacterium]|nr:MAG: VOC family protein [Gammaproteobacteria bacterium]
MKPPAHFGLHHVALNVEDLEACEAFYTGLLGMRVEWRPDADNLYLTSGTDNLALHRAQGPFPQRQHLDHIGFMLKRPEDVDAWHAFLKGKGVRIKAPPRTHRDGARSFYCLDPEGNAVQFIYHPPLAHGIP